MTFSLPHFWKFASHVYINTKERGRIRLIEPFGTQRWVMQRIAAGLERDIHSFTTLKCRQIGLSTITLALDMYWCFRHRGLNATIVVHEDDAAQDFRSQLDIMYRELPIGWKPKRDAHNRSHFSFRFQDGSVSKIQYQVAGTKMKGGGKLGRSKGNAYLHATEMSSWGDQEGLMSLRASLAEINPNRLYHWESTARGFNRFYDIWLESKRAMTQEAIFVSWWAHDLYRLSRDDPRFKVYWGTNGRMTAQEREHTRDVSLLYGDAMQFVNGTKEISPEQWAWYRWYGAERVGDEMMLEQEMPTTEHHAFVVTGSQYFTARGITTAYNKLKAVKTPQYYRIEVRHTFSDTQVIACPKNVATLTIWEPPEEGAAYVMGADPAFGSSEWADRFCLSVWKCYADRIVQVAEFCDPDLQDFSFAWIMCYLAGSYSIVNSKPNIFVYNLEITGPGQAVLSEINNLRRLSWTGQKSDRSFFRDFTGNMSAYLYRRMDVLSQIPSAIHWKSTLNAKERMMGIFRNYFERGVAEVKSEKLLDEMKGIIREEGCAPSASGRSKDDRVIAAGLAVEAWNNQLVQRLTQMGRTYEEAQRAKDPTMTNAAQTVINRQLLKLGMVGTKR